MADSPTTHERAETAPPLVPENAEAHPRPAALRFDLDAYAHYLEGCDLSDRQQRELLTAIWNVVVGIVDMGFGIPALEQLCVRETLEGDSSAVLESGDISKTKNSEAVDRPNEGAAVGADS